jgi:hypothetical protein
VATRTLQIVLAGDAGSASRAFKQVERDSERMGKKVDREGGRIRGFATITSKGMGRVGLAAGGMAAAGAGAAALLAKSFVTGATSIDESLSKNRVLFGKHAEQVEKWSKNTAQFLGISRQAALEAAGTFGNLFTALDLGPKKSQQMSTALVGLAADLASFNNATPEEALEAIRSGLVGETEPLRRFGVNLNDATLRAEALRMGLVKTTKESLEPQTKALAVNSLLFKQTEKAQGDFQRTSGGLANQQRILKAQLADTGAELGGKLMPFALRAAKALNSLFDSSSSGGRVIQGLGRAFGRAADWIKGAMQDAIQWVERFRKRNKEDIDGVIAAMRSLAKWARNVFDTVVDVIRPVLPHTKRILEGVVQVIRGLIRIVSGLISGDWDRVWDGAKDIVGGALRALRGVITGSFAFLKAAVSKLGKRLVDELGDALGGLWTVVRDGVKSGVRKGIDAAKGALGDIVGSLNPFGDGMGKIGRRIGEGIGKTMLPPLGGFGSAGGLQGASKALAPFAALGGRFGLAVTSGKYGRENKLTSSGNVSYHSTGEALDIGGNQTAMLNFAKMVAAKYGGQLAELIHTPLGFSISNGAKVPPFAQADHYDHVHVALDLGRPGPGDGWGRKPKTGDGPGVVGAFRRAIQTTNAPRKAALALFAAGIVESGLRNLSYGDADSEGALQLRVGLHGRSLARDPYRSALAFLTRGFTGRGGAIALARGGMRAAQIAQAVQGSAYPGRYGQVLGQASRYLAAGSGRSGGGGGGGGSGGGGGGGGTGPVIERDRGTTSLGAIPRGPGASLGPAGELVRAETQEARARAQDNLKKLIKSRQRQIALKRSRLRLIRKVMRGKIPKTRRLRLLQEEGQLVEEIDALASKRAWTRT